MANKCLLGSFRYRPYKILGSTQAGSGVLKNSSAEGQSDSLVHRPCLHTSRHPATPAMHTFLDTSGSGTRLRSYLMPGSITGLSGLGSDLLGGLLCPWLYYDVLRLSSALEHRDSGSLLGAAASTLSFPPSHLLCKPFPIPVLKLQPTPVPWPAIIVPALRYSTIQLGELRWQSPFVIGVNHFSTHG